MGYDTGFRNTGFKDTVFSRTSLVCAHLEHGGDEVGADEQRPPGDGRGDELRGGGLVQRIQTPEVPRQQLHHEQAHAVQLTHLHLSNII